MFRIRKKMIRVSVCLLLTACLLLPSAGMAETATVDLLVYSGAGLKKAMEAVKTAYEADHDVNIEYAYAGSAQLISQIKLAGKGDVFIVGSETAYYKLNGDGYASDTYYRVAHHTPCIIVQAGNPKGITGLEDLAGEGIRVILGDPEANAIGETAQKILTKTGLTGINDNVVAQTATVNEITALIASGQSDAGIVTVDNVCSNPDVEMIAIAPEQNLDQLIPVCTLTISEHPVEAQAFVEFIASDAGKAIFAAYGFAAAKEEAIAN